MKVFQFRVLIDNVDGVFRDIQISEKSTFLELHNTIIEAFSFSGMEMASFYVSDEEWEKGEEITLMDIMADPDQDPVKLMDEMALNDIVGDSGDRLLYVYDFMKLWIFYVELTSIMDATDDSGLPKVTLLVGDAPAEDSIDEAGAMKIELDESDPLFDSEFDIDDDNRFESFDDSIEY